MKALLVLACAVLMPLRAEAAVFSFEFIPTTIYPNPGAEVGTADVKGFLTANFGRNYLGDLRGIDIVSSPLSDQVDEYLMQDDDNRPFYIHDTSFTGYIDTYNVKHGVLIDVFTNYFRIASAEGVVYYSAPIKLHAIDTIPEPSTWSLMISGLGLIGVFARRRLHMAVI